MNTTRKKLLFVTSLSGKRLNRFMMASVLASKEIGYEFHLACNTNNSNKFLYAKDCRKHGVILHHIDFNRNPINFVNIKAFFQLIQLLREKFDIIHTNTPIGGLLGRIVSIGFKIKVIYTAHGFHFYKGSPLFNWLFFYPVEFLLSFFTDVLITINNEDFETSKRLKAKSNYFVPGVGYESSSISRNNNKDSISKKVRLISVGELNSNKNHEIVIKAISNFNNVEYYICGEGDRRSHLEKLIKLLGLTKVVKILGYRTDVKDLLNKSHIFVFPSFREGLPISIMEAMDAGLPCVVSNIRGNRDLIDSNGGFLFNDFDGLFFGLKKLINDSNLRFKMGSYNKERLKHFSIEKVVGFHVDLYKSLGGYNEKIVG